MILSSTKQQAQQNSKSAAVTSTSMVIVSFQLNIIYTLTIFLCCFIILWIVLFPSTWLIGRFGTTFHHRFLTDPIISSSSTNTNNNSPGSSAVPVPPSYPFKFEGHTAVHVLHNLPGAIWAVLIPIQYYYGTKLVATAVGRRLQQQQHQQQQFFGSKESSNSTKYQNIMHRYLGYIYIVCTIVIIIGFIVIVQRKLTIEHSFPDVPYHIFSLFYTSYLVLISIWFLYTVSMGYYYARIKHMYRIHSYWMIRNIGSALWIAVMRNLIPIIGIPFGPYTRRGQRDGFAGIGFVSGIITMSLAEYTIVLLKKQQKQKQQQQQKME